MYIYNAYARCRAIIYMHNEKSNDVIFFFMFATVGLWARSTEDLAA